MREVSTKLRRRSIVPEPAPGSCLAAVPNLLAKAVRNSKTASGGLRSLKLFQECRANVPAEYDLLSFVQGGPVSWVARWNCIGVFTARKLWETIARCSRRRVSSAHGYGTPCLHLTGPTGTPRPLDRTGIGDDEPVNDRLPGGTARFFRDLAMVRPTLRGISVGRDDSELYGPSEVVRYRASRPRQPGFRR